MKTHLLCALLSAFSLSLLSAQTTTLVKQGTATQLRVDGKPYLILGGELGNSSASSPQDIVQIFPKLKRMGLNTVLVPAYWDLIEPVEGQYDFTLVDKVIAEARSNDLKVVFLWFGAWKNSMSCYAPLWFKQDYKKYPRAYTRAGKPLEIASAFSEQVFLADSRAFTAWLNHLASIDGEQGTVIMIQIENEIGMLEDARDYSRQANALFEGPVPASFLNFLKQHKKELHPQMLAKWEAQGCRTSGTWQQVFGADVYTDEVFMAYHYAAYVERMAQIARRIFNVPLYVNAAMNSRNRKPGEYPSAGPLAHLIDVWHCAAPSLDFLSPDLYDQGFASWTAQYKLHNNPLFIPEAKLCDDNGVRAFYVIGEHDAMGMSPFSIEDGSDAASASLPQAYGLLRQMTPLLLRYQGQGVMKGLLFDQQNKERILTMGDVTLTCRHNFTLPWDPRATNGSPWPEGGGLVIQMAPHEYLVAGSGLVISFDKVAPAGKSIAANSQQALGEDGFVASGDDSSSAVQTEARFKGSRLGIGYCDEVQVLPDGTLSYVRRLNGDQDHQGRHVRISVGDWKVLHVQLYEYK